jgi:hypothetical protein
VERITVTRPVIIKVRLTEKYKELLLERLKAALAEAERELQRVAFQARRTGSNPETQGASDDIAKARREKAELKERLRSQYEAVKSLAPGAEVIQGRTECLVDIGVGDDARILNAVEVVVEEGKIVAVREQG